MGGCARLVGVGCKHCTVGVVLVLLHAYMCLFKGPRDFSAPVMVWDFEDCQCIL